MKDKNQIIIDDVSFYLMNVNGTGTNLYVHASAQDTTENDMYTVDIYTVNESHEIIKLHSNFYIDSCGNLEGEESMLDDLENAALDVLFIVREHGIIRGF